MTISPGPFDTPLFTSMPPNAYQRLLDAAQFPKRAGKPAEYGQLVVSIVENPRSASMAPSAWGRGSRVYGRLAATTMHERDVVLHAAH
jgi:hypothetical protein